MIPASFRALRLLERLNVAAVGLSLAAVTSSVFGVGFHERTIGLWSGVSTLIFGTLWARLLRWPQTFPNSTFRVAWVLSVPLAATNAGLALGLIASRLPEHFRVSEFFGGLFLGSTVGVIFWGPALAMTLLCFGAPIAWAQQSARKGLSGQERGEFVVGAASALLALAGLALSFTARESADFFFLAGLWFARSAALAGAASALAAMAVSRARADRRRAFVAEVEAGRVERFRIDTTNEGKALVRIVSQGEGYRVADLEEEVAAIDREGDVTRGAR